MAARYHRSATREKRAPEGRRPTADASRHRRACTGGRPGSDPLPSLGGQTFRLRLGVRPSAFAWGSDLLPSFGSQTSYLRLGVRPSAFAWGSDLLPRSGSDLLPSFGGQTFCLLLGSDLLPSLGVRPHLFVHFPASRPAGELRCDVPRRERRKGMICRRSSLVCRDAASRRMANRERQEIV
jgi:hypothetical protein